MSKEEAKTLDDIFKHALENQVKAWAKQGISEKEIAEKLEKIDFSKLTKQLSTQATHDMLSFYKEHMNEIDADEQAKEAEFCEHLLQKWGKCFSACFSFFSSFFLFLYLFYGIQLILLQVPTFYLVDL